MSNVYLEKLRSISGMPPVRELPKLSKGAFGSFGSTATTRILENEATPDLHLHELLAQYGGFAGVDWQGLALTDAEKSALWIVQRPDGLLTVLATVGPIQRPKSYRQAWPARFTSPEPRSERQAERDAILSIARAKLRGI
jgi:hypothetical protein